MATPFSNPLIHIVSKIEIKNAYFYSVNILDNYKHLMNPPTHSFLRNKSMVPKKDFAKLKLK